MRIPWFISLLSSIFVLVGVFYLGSKNYSFTTPPTEQELLQAVENWRTSNPSLPERDIPLSALTSVPTIPPASESPAAEGRPKTLETEIVPPPDLPIGDVITRPALDHFSTYSDSSETLFALALQLQRDQLNTHALLACERILDTLSHNEAYHAKALKFVSDLKLTSGTWNIDPRATERLTIHFTVPSTHTELCTPVFKLLTASIENASGYTVTAEIIIKEVTQKQGLPLPPISIWCSVGENETPRHSFQILKKDPKQLSQQAQRGLYHLIQQHISQHTELITPVNLNKHDDPALALRLKLTRLVWLTFAENLAQESNSSATSTPIKE